MSGSGAKGECARSVPLLKSIHDKTRVRGCGNQTDALRFQMDRTGYLVELTGRQNLLHRLFYATYETALVGRSTGLWSVAFTHQQHHDRINGHQNFACRLVMVIAEN